MEISSQINVTSSFIGLLLNPHVFDYYFTESILFENENYSTLLTFMLLAACLPTKV